MANGSTPQGCGPSVDSLYSNLCDLKAAWGIVLEAFAAAGLVFSVVLVLSLLASLPFMHGRNRRGSVPLHAFLLLFTAGLFCLTFAFIVGKDFATCASRRFLFGVLFGGCFSCLLMQSVRVNVLTRTGSGPRAWRLCLGALGLWLVEVIINAEWLIVTVVRHPQGPLNATGAAPCNIANEDFAMALIYVMTLLLAALAASVAALAGGPGRWRREGVCILLAGLLSVGIWVAWVAMYVYGNGARGSPAWDDPTLAVALVANAWAFLLLYSIPQLCCLSRDDDPQEALGEVYPERAVGYETVLKDQGYQNMFMENKGFSMDEPNQGSKPVSPYSGYTGQLRASVYQPTELAIITKAGGNPSVDAYEVSIPRASLGPSAPGGSSPLQLQDAPWKANGSGI
ncbi:G-protein coupled receptor family C group 5 member C isoform X2 [Betta splendens]|uniref:G-protein coupled receptor family C group 5 member C isoform X2 n=1 Tax=Betta splendens TaxID=158456 RepID=A0A9W2XFI8_BETSP|nr:G-protein coupled receptor family C group 5 member C isoform X2 [Betta splendens]